MASNRLTAAMMPSSRLVVPSWASMTPSEWRHLAARKTMGWLSRLANHVAQHPPALAGDVGGVLHGAAQTAEFPHEVFERRFDLPAHGSAAFGEEEEAGQAAERSADQGCSNDLSVVHTVPPSCDCQPN